MSCGRCDSVIVSGTQSSSFRNSSRNHSNAVRGDQELEAGMGASLAQLECVSVDRSDGAGAFNSLVHRDKEVDILRYVRLGGESPANVKVVARSRQ